MSSAVIFQWLDRIGLGFAVPNFAALGVDSPQALMNIDVGTYDALGISNGACADTPGMQR